MYIRGLIPRNFADLAGAVPIGGKAENRDFLVFKYQMSNVRGSLAF